MTLSWKNALGLGATAAVIAGAALAQGQPPGPGMGPGMMGQQPAPGGGPGYGMGPGMMGRGMGPGAMGYGMGPGMMAPGMIGGRGMGAGMMHGVLWSLDLGDAQRSQILKIQDDLRRKNWDLMGKSQDEMAKLRDSYLAAGKRDRKAILDTYKRIDELRLQRIDNALDAAEKIESVLTADQRDQLKRQAPWWARELAH